MEYTITIPTTTPPQPPVKQQLGFFARSVTVNNNTACQWTHIKGSNENWVPPGRIQVVFTLSSPTQVMDIDTSPPPGDIPCHAIRQGEYMEITYSDQQAVPSTGFTLSGSTSPAAGDVSGAINLNGDPSNLTVVGLQGVGVSTTSPTNGQVLEFNSILNLWVPTTITTPTQNQTVMNAATEDNYGAAAHTTFFTFPQAGISESQAQGIFTTSVLLANITVTVEQSPGVGQTFTYSLRRNGLDVVVLIIAGANVTASSSPFPGGQYVQGDFWCIKASSSAGSAGPGRTHVQVST